MENLDREMAEKVMGWVWFEKIRDFDKFGTKWRHNFKQDNPGFVHEDGTFITEKEWNDSQFYFKGSERTITKADWHPSTNIAQAFMVVERMEKSPKRFLLSLVKKASGYDLNGDPIWIWVARFRGCVEPWKSYESESGSSAEAICLAAREAMKEGQSSSPNTP